MIEVEDVRCRRKKNVENIVALKNFDNKLVDNSVHVLKDHFFKINHSYLYNLKVNGILNLVCKNVFMGIHRILLDRLERICHLLF